MNTYLVGIYVLGKSGRKFQITISVKGNNKDIAIEITKKLITDEGFTFGGIDYCDWAD